MKRSKFDIPNSTRGVSLADIEEDRQHMDALREYQIRYEEWQKYQENGSDARPPEKPVHPKYKMEEF